jgi:hypothetical protein
MSPCSSIIILVLGAAPARAAPGCSTAPTMLVVSFRCLYLYRWLTWVCELSFGGKINASLA